MRTWGFILLLSMPLFVQYLAVSPKAKEDVGTPGRKPEPQRALTRPPELLFHDLTNRDQATRANSLTELIGSDLGDSGPVDATLRAVDLNQDGGLEYIVAFHSQRWLKSYVVIADRRGDRWQVIGQFRYWQYWNAEEAEHLVEVHAPFILIREFGGGTGVKSTKLRLYRYWNGALYDVFDIVEHARFWEAQAPGVANVTTNASVLFRDERISPEPVLEVREEHRTEFRDSRRPEIKRSCKGYEWLATSFSFQPTARATNTLCRARAH